MSLSDLAAIGSFVSGIAVVISFVFLAMQLRQNARNQRALIHNERAALVQELVISITEGDGTEIRLRGDAADQTLDTVQGQKYLFIALSTLRLFEEFFYQHRDGMIDHSRWDTNNRRVRYFLRAPGMRAAWRTLSDSFAPDFAQWLDQIVRETPAATDPHAAVTAWREFGKNELGGLSP